MREISCRLWRIVAKFEFCYQQKLHISVEIQVNFFSHKSMWDRLRKGSVNVNHFSVILSTPYADELLPYSSSLKEFFKSFCALSVRVQSLRNFLPRLRMICNDGFHCFPDVRLLYFCTFTASRGVRFEQNSC